jgi:hypothetical protein
MQKHDKAQTTKCATGKCPVRTGSCCYFFNCLCKGSIGAAPFAVFAWFLEQAVPLCSKVRFVDTAVSVTQILLLSTL